MIKNKCLGYVSDRVWCDREATCLYIHTKEGPVRLCDEHYVRSLKQKYTNYKEYIRERHSLNDHTLIYEDKIYRSCLECSIKQMVRYNSDVKHLNSRWNLNNNMLKLSIICLIHAD